MEFRPMPKTPRFSREIVITEKIDGTNASVNIVDFMALPEWDFRGAFLRDPHIITKVGSLAIRAGSRTRWITPDDDNHGFARWVTEHAEELVLLGPGHHFGEWWGRGIQRGYGLEEKRFSLFNVGRWWDGLDPDGPPEGMLQTPNCCGVVPVLLRGPFTDTSIQVALDDLRQLGSHAAPGFMDPEGIMIYHTAAGQLFKKTLKGDEEGKHAEAHPAKVRPPKEPRDPSKGGRRVAHLLFKGPDRRKKI